MNLSVTPALDALAVQVTLKRFGKPYYGDDGELKNGHPTETAIRAVVQPVNGFELMDLPEGVREEAKYAVWSRSEILNDDRIIHASKEFRVMKVSNRPEGGYTKVILGLT